MRGTAYYCTVEELQERGRDDIPEQFRSNTHLIYSSPATRRVEKPEDVVHEGDEIMVKVTEIDDKGRINLSRKALLQEKK